jgi:hypothetical protein
MLDNSIDINLHDATAKEVYSLSSFNAFCAFSFSLKTINSAADIEAEGKVQIA